MPIADLQGFEHVCTLEAGAASIDDNGHVNVAHYGIFFEEAACVWHPQFGMSDAYKDATGCTFFASETHMKFFREVLPGGRMDIHARVAELSPKAMLSVLLMVDPESGELFSAQELLWLHVDLASRRVRAMPAELAGRLEQVVARQGALRGPLPLKRAIEFRR